MIEWLTRKFRGTDWKNLPFTIFNYIFQHMQNGIHKLSQQTSHLGLHSQHVARLFPFKKPPILLLSYPRSGSSWIGEVLSHSPDIAYLREPINQSLVQNHEFHALIDPKRDDITQKLYTKYADLAFAGTPLPSVRDVVHNKDDFTLLSRSKKFLLIKEVNPIASDLLMTRYSPYLIFLLRHPAAIADSFFRMGWLTKEWEKFGFDYGRRMNEPLKYITSGNCSIIKFENFASHPRLFFDNLYKDLGIQKPDHFELIIEKYSKDRKPVSSPYQVKRLSKEEIEKWRNNLSPEQIKAVRNGYMRSGFPYYRGDAEWM